MTVNTNWISDLPENAADPLPLEDDYAWMGLVGSVRARKRKQQGEGSTEWIVKKLSTSYSMPPVKEKSASSIDNPLIANLVASKKASSSKSGRSAKGGVSWADLSGKGAAERGKGEGEGDDDRLLTKEDEDLLLNDFMAQGVLKPLNATMAAATSSSLCAPPECLCNPPLAALRTTVRKEGPNCGRAFFKCNKPNVSLQCNFMLWADQNENPGATVTATSSSTTTTAAAAASVESRSSILSCDCDSPAHRFRALSGAFYYKCAKWDVPEKKCNYFRWESALNEEAKIEVETEMEIAAAADSSEKSPFVPVAESPLNTPSPTRCRKSFPANEKVADFLDDLAQKHKTGWNQNDEYRFLTFKRAAEKVRYFHLPLEFGNEAAFEALGKKRGMGTKTVDKIREFVMTGQSSRLDAFKTDKYRVAVEALSNVWGMAQETARV